VLLLWLALRQCVNSRLGCGSADPFLCVTGHTAQVHIGGGWHRCWRCTAIVQFWFVAVAAVAVPPLARLPPGSQRFSWLATRSVPMILHVDHAATLLPIAARVDLYIGLLLKVLAFATLMALAAANKWRLGPALAHDSAAAKRLRFTVGLEYVLIGAVLMGTAALTTFWSPEV
jgi:putative copper export protein